MSWRMQDNVHRGRLEGGPLLSLQNITKIPLNCIPEPQQAVGSWQLAAAGSSSRSVAERESPIYFFKEPPKAGSVISFQGIARISFPFMIILFYFFSSRCSFFSPFGSGLPCAD